jgi:c-di-GMP-binding flagellar brake protein YcgR
VQTEEQPSEEAVQRRRYVRLNITSQIDLKLIVPESEQMGGFIPFCGELLNVSAGGILIGSEEAMPEDAFVVMEFELNGSDRIAGVVGRIRRCETESDSSHLIGIEFCTSDDIAQNCPPEYRKLLNEECSSFDDKVRQLINRYVFNRKVQEKSEEVE